MILLHPIVLGSAVVIWGRRTGVSPGGWPWFAAWTVAGALMTFSFLTGFSMGLFLLPLSGALVVALMNSAAGSAVLFAGLVIGLGAIAAYSAALAKRA